MKHSQYLFSTKELDEVIRQLLPEGAHIQIDYVACEAKDLTIEAVSTQQRGSCPVCGHTTMRIHSRYKRTLQDLPWRTIRVRLHVQVHRFFCENPRCPRRIFTERLPQLAEPSARRTDRLREAIVGTGWALGGEAGARKS